MPITFQAIHAATRTAAEPGHLVWVHDRLVALLVEAEDGWYLEHGLGPIAHEGVLFSTIGAAEQWIRSRLAEPEGGDGLAFTSQLPCQP